MICFSQKYQVIINFYLKYHILELGYYDVIPLSIEDQLNEAGAIFEKTSNWQSHVITDERLVTGQNPASTPDVVARMVSLVA